MTDTLLAVAGAPGTAQASPASTLAAPTAAAPPQVAASSTASHGGAVATPPSPQPATPATRLLVEPDGARGYIYRLVDATTGRVLVELPRSQLDQLKAHPAYTAGAIASRSA
jgi:hypothetical protein